MVRPHLELGGLSDCHIGLTFFTDLLDRHSLLADDESHKLVVDLKLDAFRARCGADLSLLVDNLLQHSLAALHRFRVSNDENVPRVRSGRGICSNLHIFAAAPLLQLLDSLALDSDDESDELVGNGVHICILAGRAVGRGHREVTWVEVGGSELVAGGGRLLGLCDQLHLLISVALH